MTESVEQLASPIEAERIAAIQTLAAIYDPISQARDYELLATRVATGPARDIVRLTLSIAEDENYPKAVRVFASVACAIACRRSRLQSEGRHVIRLVQHMEDQFPILRHMRALAQLDGTPADLRDGLALAEQVFVHMPHNPGVQHALANFLVDVSYLDGHDESDRPILERALGLVNEALRVEQRPKFFYTRARIRRRLGLYQEAKADLATAIDLEDRRTIDHRERITSYLIESSLVDAERAISESIRKSNEIVFAAQEKMHDMDGRLNDALVRIREAQARVVETIAFFAAALALIQFTAITLGKEYSLRDSLTLIGGLGVILFAAVFFGSWLLRRRLR